MSIETTLVYNKSNPFGIKADAAILEGLLGKCRHADRLEPPMSTDICIHLEMPSTTWMPWARKNVLMMNPEWWVPAWDVLLPRFDLVLVKTKGITDLSGATYVPWRPSVTVDSFSDQARINMIDVGCLWLLGGSVNKRAAAQAIAPLWKAEYPQVYIYTTTVLDLSGAGPNVHVIVTDLDETTRRTFQAHYPVHLAISRSEGFGLAAAEAEAAGAYIIANTIPAYTTAFEGQRNIGWVRTPTVPSPTYTRAEFAEFSGSAEISADLDRIFAELRTVDLRTVRQEQQDAAKARALAFETVCAPLFKALRASIKGSRPVLPPIVSMDDCPPISIVTLTYNRRKFIDVAFHNILMCDYPKDKIEWVVVDDSDNQEESVSDKIATFAKRAPVAQVVYIPLGNTYTVGGKRNIGVERSKNEIILFMDDDDHYPATSFRRRVSWLLAHPWKPKAVACSTIACYDLVKGVSAVNTPPWELSPAQRISEATLAFYKSFWKEQKFPFINTSEGEGFLQGREQYLLDMPPQQILVAFSHQGNTSGRRIPVAADTKPGCFWGFPKEYLVWIHKLAGIEVEEETS